MECLGVRALSHSYLDEKQFLRFLSTIPPSTVVWFGCHVHILVKYDPHVKEKKKK